MTDMAESAIRATRAWVEQVVVGYQLCPFARTPFKQNTIRYVSAADRKVSSVKTTFLAECKYLDEKQVSEVSTTLLILTGAFQDFFTFWELVGKAEEWLEEAGYAGLFQVASFHPDYIFAEATTEAAQNYTNRSPWPMLHLIREDELETAIKSHPDIEAVPQRNIELMESKGKDHWKKVLKEIKIQAQATK